ncbi:MAG: hypothetical protein IPL32_03445 [Chloracidobacterium sp.]|nr:hypothetical protein [Chloracidobacterium sp.]
MINERQPKTDEALDYDPEVWEELNQHLWEVVTNTPQALARSRDLHEDSSAISAMNLRKESCLSFERCEEIAHIPDTLTSGESQHLKDCRYCEQRIAACPPLLVSEPLKTQQQFGTATRENKGFMTEFLDSLSAVFSHPMQVAAFVVLISLIGALGFFMFRGSSEPQRAADQPRNEPDLNLIASGDERIDSVPPGSETQVKPHITMPTPPLIDLPETAKSPDPTKNGPSIDKRVDTSTPPIDLNGIPRAMHAFIINVRNSAMVTESTDLKRFLVGSSSLVRRDRVRGGARPLSPVRKSITESQPVFRWEARTDTTFEISLLNSEKKEVASAKNLIDNVWKPPFNLSPGIYYWGLSTIDKDGKYTARDVAFKIVDRAEVDRVKSENQSHLDKASYFIYVGLLDEAAGELNAELKKNPNSRKARTVLRQVMEWQRKLR